MAGAPKVTRQAAYIVAKGGKRRLAVWVEVVRGGARGAHVAVLRPQRTLFPSSGCAIGLEASAKVGEGADAEGAFRALGYEVEGSIGFDCDELLGLF